MSFYSSYDYEFKFLYYQINDNDYLESAPTRDLNHSHEIQAKSDRFDNDYTLKESIVKLNQSIESSKLTIAKLLIDIDKTKLSVIHSTIVLNVLSSNIFLYALQGQREQFFSSSRVFSDEQKEQNFSEIIRMILIASEKLSSVKTQLNSLYKEYHGVEYKPSKFPEIETKLKALERKSIDVRALLESFLW